LANLLRRESYDVVICHQPWTCVLFASVVRSAGLPVVIWVHMASDGRHWLDRFCHFTRPDLALCNSQFTARCTSSWLPQTTVQYEYCPVSRPTASIDAAGRETIRRSLQTPADDVVIVQVSRLEAFKGQRVLLRALSELQGLQRWTCWIVGGAQRTEDLDYLRDLQALARDLGVSDRVRFTGERADVPRLLSAADVYCQPNLEPEGFGLTFIEAMAAGLPVVTSAIGAAEEIIHESCGVLVRPNDVSGLVDALRLLVSNSGARARLGTEARKRPDELCNPAVQMRRIQAVLSSVATSSRFEAVRAVNTK
jgi:glycosyltransferase involved in cell wall biosynthesis